MVTHIRYTLVKLTEIEARTPWDNQPCTAQNTSSANFPTVPQARHKVILPIQSISKVSLITEPEIYLEGEEHRDFPLLRLISLPEEPKIDDPVSIYVIESMHMPYKNTQSPREKIF